MTPEDQAVATADFCFRAMQFDESDLESVRKAAARIDLQIALPDL